MRLILSYITCNKQLHVKQSIPYKSAASDTKPLSTPLYPYWNILAEKKYTSQSVFSSVKFASVSSPRCRSLRLCFSIRHILWHKLNVISLTDCSIERTNVIPISFYIIQSEECGKLRSHGRLMWVTVLSLSVDVGIEWRPLAVSLSYCGRGLKPGAVWRFHTSPHTSSTTIIPGSFSRFNHRALWFYTTNYQDHFGAVYTTYK